MTEERDFDRLARAWLELGPEQAPDRAIAAVLQAVETTPQVRPRRWGTQRWRLRPANRTFSLAAVAAAVLVVAGAALWINWPSGPDGNPVVAASPSPAPAVTTAPTLAPSPTPVAATPTPVAASPTASTVSGNATAVAAGFDFTCAITSSGGVKCWGINTYGQLGNGATTDADAPVDVSGLTSAVSAIAVGAYHTCALTQQGGVQCWGRNDGGQLGDGTVFDSNVPVDVSGLEGGVTAITAGSGFNCALTTGGGVKCWGWNYYGQMGNGISGANAPGTTFEKAPVNPAGLTDGATAISGGSRHACAVTDAGGITCWGGNAWGQLGDGSTTSSLVPVDVAGLPSRPTALATGDFHTCALLQGGGVSCWGDNRHGQIGDGSTAYSAAPVDVSGLAGGVTAISAGRSAIAGRHKDSPEAFHTCALLTQGGVQCWGRNDSGQLGNGITADSSVPVDVAGFATGVAAISAGASHTCALTDAGGVICWGSNANGELGDGTTTSSSTPVVVSGL